MGGDAVHSDADLIGGLIAGDEAALVELYDRYATVVFGVGFRLLGDRGTAEEVMQETFLALWHRAELFNASLGSVSTWLVTIARNRAVDRLRAASRRPPPMPISSVAGTDETSDDVLERITRSGSLLAAGTLDADPEVIAERAWLRGAVYRALDAIPEPDRRAIELAYYEDLTQTEIAARLGWPLGTVKTRTRRALLRLRGVLAETLGPELGRRVAPVPIPADDRIELITQETAGNLDAAR